MVLSANKALRFSRGTLNGFVCACVVSENEGERGVDGSEGGCHGAASCHPHLRHSIEKESDLMGSYLLGSGTVLW